MNIIYHGPFIAIRVSANELTEGHSRVQLKEGYTYEVLHINYLQNITELKPYLTIYTKDTIRFPVVNSKSPSVIDFLYQMFLKKLKLDLPSKNLDKYRIPTILIKNLNQF